MDADGNPIIEVVDDGAEVVDIAPVVPNRRSDRLAAGGNPSGADLAPVEQPGVGEAQVENAVPGPAAAAVQAASAVDAQNRMLGVLMAMQETQRKQAEVANQRHTEALAERGKLEQRMNSLHEQVISNVCDEVEGKAAGPPRRAADVGDLPELGSINVEALGSAGAALKAHAMLLSADNSAIASAQNTQMRMLAKLERQQAAQADTLAAQASDVLLPATVGVLVKEEFRALKKESILREQDSYIARMRRRPAPVTMEGLWQTSARRLRNIAGLHMDAINADAVEEKVEPSPAQKKALEHQAKLAEKMQRATLQRKNLDTPISEYPNIKSMLLVASALEKDVDGNFGEIGRNRGVVTMRMMPCRRRLNAENYSCMRSEHNLRVMCVMEGAAGKKLDNPSTMMLIDGDDLDEEAGGGAMGHSGIQSTKAEPRERAAEVGAICILQLCPDEVVVRGWTCGNNVQDDEVRELITRTRLARPIKREMNKDGFAYRLAVPAAKAAMLTQTGDAVAAMSDAVMSSKLAFDGMFENLEKLVWKAHTCRFDWGILADLRTVAQRHLSNQYRGELLVQDLKVLQFLRRACNQLVARRVDACHAGQNHQNRVNTAKAKAHGEVRRYLFLHLIVRMQLHVAICTAHREHVFCELVKDGTDSARAIDNILKTAKWS
jgi:hypothetical protein